MGRYHKLDTLIANIAVHKALNTPHSWVHIPNVIMHDGLKRPKAYDIRVCKLCYHGEKLIGRGDKIWSSLEGYDTLTLLNRYLASQKQEAR